MENLKKDRTSMKRRIGGDTCVLENVEERERLETSVKQLPTPTNIKKSMKKKGGRKSLPAPKHPKSKPQPKPTPVSKRRTSAQPKVVKRPLLSNTLRTHGYYCQLDVDCNFTTDRFTLLKLHMSMHKNNTYQKMVEKSISSTSNKRKNLKTKLPDDKKIKLQEELLKDWENDDEDEDVELNTIDVQSTRKVLPIANEIIQIASEDALTTDEVLSTSKVLSSKNDVIPTLNNIQEPSTSSPDRVFEFNENDDNTPVEKLLRGLPFQKWEMPIVGKFKMDNFKEDVISTERHIGDDTSTCVFENIEENQESLKTSVKQFFTPIPNAPESTPVSNQRKSPQFQYNIF